MGKKKLVEKICLLRPTYGKSKSILPSPIASVGVPPTQKQAAAAITPYWRRRDGNVTPYRRQGEMGLLRPTGGRMGWECFALPAAGWDGIASPTGGVGMVMLRPTGGRMGWECFALPAAGWDGIATPYRRQDGMGMIRPTGGRVGWDCFPYRRQGGMGLLPLPAA